MGKTNYFEKYIDKLKELQEVVSADIKAVETDAEASNITKLNISSFIHSVENLIQIAKNNDYVENGRYVEIVPEKTSADENTNG